MKKLNKKGSSSIEIVIGMMIFIMAVCFFMDVLILSWKYSVVAQTTTQVARISSVQGGVNHSAPSDYHGGYTTINQLNSSVREKMNSAGVKNNEWRIDIAGGRIGKNGVSPTGNIDYKQEFQVQTTIDYRWQFTSNFIPGMSLTQSITAKRPAMSEWKHNYNSWIGE